MQKISHKEHTKHMELKNVRVEYSVEATVNTGNFTNVRPGYRVSADVPEGVSPSEVRSFLKDKVDAWLEADVDAIAAEKNA